MTDNLFEAVSVFPDPEMQERYLNLVGLDRMKEQIEKEAVALLRPDLLEKWSREIHGERLPALELLRRRPPLIIFAGDVGTGKTELATTFGDQLARLIDIPVELYNLSLRTRGSGAVGEMTRLLSEAFRVLRAKCPKSPPPGRKPQGATILLIDEADSLAQSRELAQMHHEDRAGVNALIRGVDDIANAKLPCLIVMCTNRVDALDPAIRRRAATILEFSRPSMELRQRLLSMNLAGTDLTAAAIKEIAAQLGTTDSRPYGFTYSDITQRLIPSVVLSAYPNGRITRELVLRVLSEIPPTPPFKAQAAL